MTKIGSDSEVSSTVIRHIFNHNLASLRSIHIHYQKEVLREETRILVEEIGLQRFENLQEISLVQNRVYKL